MFENEDQNQEQESTVDIKQETTDGTEEQGAAAGSNEGASAESDVSKEGQEATEDDLAKELVKDAEGNEYIPKTAFEKRIAALTKRNKDYEAQFEALRSNPEFREQFLKEVGEKAKVEESSKPSEAEKSEAPGWTNLTSWFERLSSNPESQAFYREYTSALINDLNPIIDHVLKTRIEAAVAPFKRYVGETTLKSFSEKNKDFSKYEPLVLKKMKETGMTHEDAYKAVKYDDLVKEMEALKAGKTSASPNQQNREKLKQTPITKRAPNPVGKSKAGAQSLDEALSDSLRELNWGKK